MFGAISHPSSNIEFWQKKFEENVARDARNIEALRTIGWRVATIWECAVRRMPEKQIATMIGHWLRGGARTFELPD